MRDHVWLIIAHSEERTCAMAWEEHLQCVWYLKRHKMHVQILREASVPYSSKTQLWSQNYWQSQGCQPHMDMISHGLGLQWLRAGLGFPLRDWVWVLVVRAPDPNLRPVVSDKGPGPLTLQKRISTRKGSSEASNLLRGNYTGTPLQYSCLENPMDGGAW